MTWPGSLSAVLHQEVSTVSTGHSKWAENATQSDILGARTRHGQYQLENRAPIPRLRTWDAPADFIDWHPSSSLAHKLNHGREIFEPGPAQLAIEALVTLVVISVGCVNATLSARLRGSA